MHHMRARLLPLAALILVAACGGGSTPAATGSPGSGTGSGGSGGGGATQAPGATAEAGGGSTGATDGAFNITNAVGALADLSNYAFRMEMKATGRSEFMLVPKDGSLVMEGTVILKPEQAADITMTTTDNASSPGVMAIRLVKDNSCVNLGGGDWMCSPIDDLAAQMESYKPESMLGSFSSMANGLSAVGDETRNGIPTTHYKGTDDTGGFLSMFGLPEGTLTTEVWVAKDGGYVVSQAITAQGTDGAFTMSMDLTKANDPSLKVEMPEGVMELPSVEP